ncbi:MAG: DUF4340 domain-containing protein [Candidatus Promineifilaceae bacterium]
MNWRVTLALLLVLAALLAFVIWQGQQPESDDDLPPVATLAPNVIDDELDWHEVEQLEISGRDEGQTVTFTRLPEGWTRSSGAATDTITDTLQTQINGLLNLDIRSSIPASQNPLAAYGLDEPAYTIALVVNLGEGRREITLRVGNDTPTVGSVYLLKEGDERVHVVVRSAVDEVAALLTPPAAPAPAGTPTPQS